MSASRQASASLWEMGAPVMGAQPLTANVEADVVIVGCGVAGLSAAYELIRSGRRVVAIDRKPIGAGMTGRSTAHLSFVSDDGFDDLISTRGFDIAQGWHASQAAAVDRIDQLQRELSIDCEFARVGTYLFLASDRLDLTVTLEIGVSFHGEAVTPALVYSDKARVNPRKYRRSRKGDPRRWRRDPYRRDRDEDCRSG